MKAIAPNLLFAGSQSVEKTPDQPSVVNHEADWFVMVTAMSTRITSTSSPDASARTWKARSPSGRRIDSRAAGPAGAAGPACAFTLMTPAVPYDVILASCATAWVSMLDGSGA